MISDSQEDETLKQCFGTIYERQLKNMATNHFSYLFTSLKIATAITPLTDTSFTFQMKTMIQILAILNNVILDLQQYFYQ